MSTIIKKAFLATCIARVRARRLHGDASLAEPTSEEATMIKEGDLEVARLHGENLAYLECRDAASRWSKNPAGMLLLQAPIKEDMKAVADMAKELMQ